MALIQAGQEGFEGRNKGGASEREFQIERLIFAGRPSRRSLDAAPVREISYRTSHGLIWNLGDHVWQTKLSSHV